MENPIFSSVSSKTASLTFAGLLGGTVLILGLQSMIFKQGDTKLHSLILPVETVAPSPEEDIGEIEGDLLAQEDHSKALEHEEIKEAETASHEERHSAEPHEAVHEPASHAVSDNIEIPTYETTPYGDIPAAMGEAEGRADVRPLDAYALESPPLSAKARGIFSVILLDYGLSEELSTKARETLPPYISVAVSPYAQNPDKIASAAYAKKFEPWGDIPLQATTRTSDSGAMALRDGVALEENQRNLYTMLARAGHVPGLIADGRGKTSESGDARLLLIEAKERGYGLVLMGKQERAEAIVGRFVALKAESALIKSFQEDALKQAQGTLFVSLTPAHLKALPDVIKSLEAAGLELVPLSRLQEPLL
ncbi:MAG: divergent polysaccharide deacetylase family protein [Pseudobdellovibrionaceae bacterium]